MKKTFIIIIILFSTISSGYGQTKKAHEAYQRIERYLNDVNDIGFYGSVLIELSGEPAVSKGYGYSNIGRQIKNYSSTIYDIGSITKQFTAAAILKLEMQGKLSTNDKLSEFIENVPADKASITIHDLLRHQSGLISNVGGDYEKISEEEFLDKILSSRLTFETGTDASYSNIGYSLLAIIIERVSRQSYEIYLYENLWKPVQMEMTGYIRPEFDTSQIATGYRYDNSVWGKPVEKAWDSTAPYWHLKGNGGILSTIEDLYKWHRCLMTEKVLSKEAKQKLYYPELRPGEDASAYYAYGWDVSQTARKTTQVWHNGSNRIFYADLLRFIDEDISLIMLSNKSHSHFNNLNFELSKIIFNPNYKPEIPAADNEVNRNFTNRILQTIATSGLEQAKAVYKKKEENEHLLEFLMRNEGFNYIDNDKPEIAMQVFQMNVLTYPASSKSLQGLAEGYMETGNKTLALKYFKESLSINPENRFVIRMIKNLEEESEY